MLYIYIYIYIYILCNPWLPDETFCLDLKFKVVMLQSVQVPTSLSLAATLKGAVTQEEEELQVESKRNIELLKQSMFVALQILYQNFNLFLNVPSVLVAQLKRLAEHFSGSKLNSLKVQKFLPQVKFWFDVVCVHYFVV